MAPNETPDFRVKDVRWVDRAAVIEATGEIDLRSSPMFQRELLKVFDSHPERIIVDLSGVPYMDSSGVASLVKLLSRVRKGNISLHLVGLTDRVKGIFEITRLDSVFDIHDNEQQALGQA